jgi:hypothetical protein
MRFRAGGIVRVSRWGTGVGSGRAHHDTYGLEGSFPSGQVFPLSRRLSYEVQMRCFHLAKFEKESVDGDQMETVHLGHRLYSAYRSQCFFPTPSNRNNSHEGQGKP